MKEGESQLLAVLDTRFCLANCFTNLSSLCRYILVYPQGCDVCNHLSLFLCVADYDKLLPGTSKSMHILDALPILETNSKFNKPF